MFSTLHKEGLQQTLRMILGHPRRPVQRVSRVGLRLRGLGQWGRPRPPVASADYYGAKAACVRFVTFTPLMTPAVRASVPSKSKPLLEA